MELTELQNIWQEYDAKLSENTRLNKEILRFMLIQKPQRRLNWIKIKACLRIFTPVILVSFLMIHNVQFYISTRFFIGLGMFLPIFIINYFWDVRYFALIRKIDFTMPIITIKKAVTEIQKYKLRTTKLSYLLMPVAIVGFFLMIIHKINTQLNIFSFLPVFLIVIVFFISMYVTFKYSISERYRKLRKEIDEIEQLERPEYPTHTL
jgi:pilus assembly protein TadC